MAEHISPHALAIQISQDNVRRMTKGSKNEVGLGQGEINAKLLLQVISGTAPCAGCAMLAINPEKKTIGCRGHENTVLQKAKMLQEGNFGHEIDCAEFAPILTGFTYIINEDGVLTYKAIQE